MERAGGGLTPVNAVPVEALYFGKSRQHPDDFYFFFLNFIFQRASYGHAIWWTRCITSDLHNLGTSIAKLRFIFQHRLPSTECARMAATELEYIFMVCRSILDLLQETLNELWPLITFPNISKKKQRLPASFADMVLRNRKPMTVEEIADRHKLPEAIAVVYAESGEFLSWFRAFRDNVTHRGESFELVFVTERGFGIKIDQLPFSKMPIWADADLVSNEIGSLHSAACYVIEKVLATFDRVSQCLLETIRWPPALSPEYVLFVRGHHIHELSHLEEGVSESPWS